MTCEHKAIRCTNGVFYCLECGIKLDPPAVEKPTETVKKSETERPKKKKRGTQE